MSIRLRTVNGIRVALCAYETDPLPGDVYLDDGEHYALVAKWAQDYQGETMTTVYPLEWAAMDSQKLRDARTRTDLGPDLVELEPITCPNCQADHTERGAMAAEITCHCGFEFTVKAVTA